MYAIIVGRLCMQCGNQKVEAIIHFCWQLSMCSTLTLPPASAVCWAFGDLLLTGMPLLLPRSNSSLRHVFRLSLQGPQLFQSLDFSH